MTNPVEYLISNYESSNYSFVSEDKAKFRADLDAALLYVKQKIVPIRTKEEPNLKDYFAIKIVQAMISNNKIYQMHPDEKSIIKDAYIVADYMIEARND